MHIKFTEVNDDKVKFDCAYGEGMGICNYDGLEEGMKCTVEINALADLIVGANVQVNQDKQKFVRIEGDETVFNMEVESIDDYDNSVCLRLSQAFIMIEYIEGSISVGDMLRINLKQDEMEIFPEGAPHW
jgi:hypothetical protein